MHLGRSKVHFLFYIIDSDENETDEKMQIWIKRLIDEIIVYLQI